MPSRQHQQKDAPESYSTVDIAAQQYGERLTRQHATARRRARHPERGQPTNHHTSLTAFGPETGQGDSTMTETDYSDSLRCAKCDDKRQPGSRLCPRCEDLHAVRTAPGDTGPVMHHNPGTPGR